MISKHTNGGKLENRPFAAMFSANTKVGQASPPIRICGYEFQVAQLGSFQLQQDFDRNFSSGPKDKTLTLLCGTAPD
jgi:hypothetical protein